ncbi:MAG: ATP-binding protein [Dinoroseobacter sp.]|nr:ATP-binding protein [Dinoroseobacter sp.]
MLTGLGASALIGAANSKRAFETYQSSLEAEISLSELSYSFQQYRYWSTQHALSLLMHAKHEAVREKNELLNWIENSSYYYPILAESIESILQKFDEDMNLAVEAYLEDQRVLGNTYTAQALLHAAELKSKIHDSKMDEAMKVFIVREKALDTLTDLEERVWWFLMCSIAFGTVFAISFAKAISNPLRKTVHALESIRLGDLNAKMPESRISEVSLLAGGLSDLKVAISERQRYFDAMNMAIDEASKANEHKTKFISTMSHEIRTPITVILGTAENLLLRSTLTSENKEDLDLIIDHCLHLKSIIHDAIDISAIEQGKVELEKSEILPNRLILDIKRLLDPLARERGLALQVRCIKHEDWVLLGDKRRISQVLLNLTSNAIKYTKSGEVVISAAAKRYDESSVELVFEVSDTGIGLSSSDFHAYAQGDKTTSKAGQNDSSGLGISISYQLAKALGGDLSARSRPQGGTVTTFSLSLEESSPSARKSNQTEQKPSIWDTPIDSPLKVAIVEDEASVGVFLSSWLKKIGLKPVHCSSKDQLLDAMKVESFDIFLVDINIGNHSGLNIISELRDKLGDAQKIIFMSAGTVRERRQLEDISGLDFYFLQKPFTKEELFEVILGSPKGMNSVIDGEAYNGSNAMKKLFLEGLFQSINDLMKAREENNLQEVESILHKIDGSASMFGENDISLEAEKLKILAENGKNVSELDFRIFLGLVHSLH